MSRAAETPAARPSWLVKAEVLRRFPFSRSTLERSIRDGSFPRPVKVGRLRMWRLEELERFEQRLLADRGQP